MGGFYFTFGILDGNWLVPSRWWHWDSRAVIVIAIEFIEPMVGLLVTAFRCSSLVVLPNSGVRGGYHFFMTLTVISVLTSITLHDVCLFLFLDSSQEMVRKDWMQHCC